MKNCWVILGFFFVCGTFAEALDSTELRFRSAEPVPIFRVGPLVAEEAGVSLTADMELAWRQMDLLTVAPSTVTLPNGNLVLNIGGDQEFNQNLALILDGTPKEILLTGNRTTARTAGYVAAFGTLAFLALPGLTSGWTSDNPAARVAIPAVAGVTAVAGAVVMVLTLPRIEVH